MTANPKQQEANGKVVARFVYACMTVEIDDILCRSWTDPIEGMTWDDVTNYPSKKEWDEVRDENPAEWGDFLVNEIEDVLKDHFINSWHRYVEADDDHDIDGFLDWLEEDCDETGSKSREEYLSEIVLEDFDQQEAWLEYAEDHNCEVMSEYDEIYEWWLVDNWFAEKLESYGQSILKLSLSSVWGRRTTGQAIALDAVITRFQKEWAPWAMPEEETYGIIEED